MNKYEACKILGLNGDITPTIVKQAYRKACKEYHPDRNPGGLEMMKSVNLAYDVLKDLEETVEINEEQQNFGGNLMAILNDLASIPGLELEFVGSWLYVGGDTKPHKDHIKSLGLWFSGKHKKWILNPEGKKKRKYTKENYDDLKARHGSQTVKPRAKKKLAA